MSQLLAAGADPNRQVLRGPSGHRGSSPLHYAIEGGHAEAIRLLASAGADLNPSRPHNVLPENYAPPIYWTLHDPELVRAMLEGGADPNAHGRGRTPMLLEAMSRRHWASALALIEHGAAVDGTDPLGRTPLEAAFAANDEQLGCLVAAMWDRGLNVNREFTCGRTALILAVQQQREVGVLRMLLEAGAEPSMRDRGGKRALDYANSREDRDRDTTIRLLQEYIR